MITYNHESFISEAIESVMMQQTSFKFELIIGEDCSTDNTRKICQEFKARYPDKIRLLLPENNLGAIANFLDTFRACNGKYVAFCEGDDYWTDPYKLQKQVDFLEANTDFVICHHNMKVIYENETRKTHLSNSSEQKEVTTIEDLSREYYIYTASLIFRNGLVKEWPDNFSQPSLGDYLLNMLIAQYGKIRYFPDVMGVYRVHENGIWSKLPENIKAERQLSLLLEFLKYFKTNNSVYSNLKIRYIELCLHLINTYKINNENRKIEIIQFLNEVEPGYFYERYIDISEKLEKLSGSRKNLFKALLRKQFYHSKKYFSQK